MIDRCERDLMFLVGGELNAGIDFLEFKSCEIAAAVAVSVAVETKTVDTEKAISVLTQYVQKVNFGGPISKPKRQPR